MIYFNRELIKSGRELIFKEPVYLKENDADIKVKFNIKNLDIHFADNKVYYKISIVGDNYSYTSEQLSLNNGCFILDIPDDVPVGTYMMLVSLIDSEFDSIMTLNPVNDFIVVEESIIDVVPDVPEPEEPVDPEEPEESVFFIPQTIINTQLKTSLTLKFPAVYTSEPSTTRAYCANFISFKEGYKYRVEVSGNVKVTIHTFDYNYEFMDDIGWLDNGYEFVPVENTLFGVLYFKMVDESDINADEIRNNVKLYEILEGENNE